jgi:hypothetical protein
VLALRARQSRAMLTTLLLSFGIPMLLGGDEMGHTRLDPRRHATPATTSPPVPAPSWCC